MSEDADSAVVFSRLESIWQTVIGPNCLPDQLISEEPVPVMLEYFGTVLMEKLMNVTEETLVIAFKDHGIVDGKNRRR